MDGRELPKKFDTRVVPRDLRNVGQSGAKIGCVSRIPIDIIRAGIRVAEVRATNRNVIRRGGKGVDADAINCVGSVVGSVVVARTPSVASLS